jgi:hypothetical protein
MSLLCVSLKLTFGVSAPFVTVSGVAPVWVGTLG